MTPESIRATVEGHESGHQSRGVWMTQADLDFHAQLVERRVTARWLDERRELMRTIRILRQQGAALVMMTGDGAGKKKKKGR